MNGLTQDLRFALRGLLRQPAFALVALVTLALGIGGNTAIFSVVNAVLLRPLPYPEPERLVAVYETSRIENDQRSNTSYANFADWRAQNQAFEAMAALTAFNPVLGHVAEPERLRAGAVTHEFFRVMGVRPALGRDFLPEEDRPGHDQVVILGDGLWRRRFGGDPGIVGSVIHLGGLPHTVTGVLPAGFEPPMGVFSGAPPEIYAPLGYDPGAPDASRTSRHLRVVARLAAGVSLEQAGSEMEAMGRRLAEQYPDENKGQGIRLMGLHEATVGQTRPALLVLMAAVGLVLMIACVNVTHLLLGRMASRRRELAVRCALGAGRMRLIRQLVTECLVLTFGGGGLGILIASWGMDGLLAMAPRGVPRIEQARLDPSVLLFTLGLCLLSGLLLGLAPALNATRRDLAAALHDASSRAGASPAASRLRGILVAGEVALSLTLLVGSGLLIRTLWQILQVDPGFEPSSALTMNLGISSRRYPEDHQKVAFMSGVLGRVGALPGVEAAGLVSTLVMDSYDRRAITIEDRPPATPSEAPYVDSYFVTPGYFAAMRIRLLSGRLLQEQDGAQDPATVVVSESFARQHWPGLDPVGRRLKLGAGPEGPRPWCTVVGVVADVRQYGLDVDPTPQVYLPLAQSPMSYLTLIVRAGGPQEGLAAAVKGMVASVDRELPVWSVRPLSEVVAGSTSLRRFSMAILTSFALLALLLAAIGTYGVLSFAVSQRTREFGIRLALGADPARLRRMVLSQGMRMVLIGMAAGGLASFGVARLMSGLLFGVSGSDPVTYGAVGLLMALVALAACYLPARRATRVDPMTALRCE